MKRIGIIDVDGKNFPNLALMKISAFHKGMGDTVEWYDPMFSGHFDKVYLSKVFSFTPDFDWPIDADEIERGGTGYCIDLVNGREVFHHERDRQLPYEIEHIYPDYSIYPELTRDTAFGFLTRGCPRGCDFCIVKDKEGRCSVKVAELSEFWRGQKNIVLCDPNILACRDWKDLLQQLIDTGSWVDFNQGLDIRLMTEEKAAMIDRIKVKEIHFPGTDMRTVTLFYRSSRCSLTCTQGDRLHARQLLYNPGTGPGPHIHPARSWLLALRHDLRQGARPEGLPPAPALGEYAIHICVSEKI